MAVFIDLWPCLFTTKLSYAQLFKWGHSKNYLNPLCLTSQIAKARKGALELLHLHIGLVQAHNKVSRVFFGQNVKIKSNKKSFLVSTDKNQNWAIFMEQKLRFGLVLGRLAILKKNGPIMSNFCCIKEAEKKFLKIW